MKILYVTLDDSSQTQSENNGYYLRDGLVRRGHEVVPVTVGKATLAEKLVFGPVKLAHRLRGIDYRAAVAPLLVRRRTARLKAQVEDVQPDVILANSPVVVAGLEAEIPYVIYTDAPITRLLSMGHYYDRWPGRLQRAFVAHDAEAVHGAARTIYHSAWAAQAAVDDYHLSSDRVRVVLPGANLEPVPAASARVEKQPGRRCELLFWGRDWVRKGGPIAVAIAQSLNQLGIAAHLTICGPATMPDEVQGLDFVTFAGRVEKDARASKATIHQIFQNADYMVLPTGADASTSAIREAAAFGVPSVVTDVGGLPELVDDARSGLLFDVETEPETYAMAIARNFQHDERRVPMRRAARAMYDDHLNWGVSVSKIEDVLRELV